MMASAASEGSDERPAASDAVRLGAASKEGVGSLSISSSGTGGSEEAVAPGGEVDMDQVEVGATKEKAAVLLIGS